MKSTARPICCVLDFIFAGRFTRLVCLGLSCILFAAAPAFCQGSGAKPFDVMSGGNLDSVSLTDGHLMVRIPLVSFPQRGSLDLSFSLIFNTTQWQSVTNCGPVNPVTGEQTCTTRWQPVPGRGVGPTVLAALLNPPMPPVTGAYVASSVDWLRESACNAQPPDPNIPNQTTYSGFEAVVAPDNTSHLFGTGTSISGCPYSPYALDATGILHPDGNTILMTNGTRFSYPIPSSTLLTTATEPNSVTDANGNQILINASTGAFTDTLGRVISVPPAAGTSTTSLASCPSGTSSASLWTVPGVASVNGGGRPFIFCYSSVSISTSFNDGNDYPPTNNTLLTAIVLPDLTKWTLTYDHWGNLAQLGLPTGGSISYTDALVLTAQGNFPVITSRTINANDGTGGHTTQYSFTGGPTSPTTYSGTTVVTTPDGNDAVHTIASPVAGAPASLFDVQVQYFQGSRSGGTLLKTVASQYSGIANLMSGDGTAMNVVSTQVATTWPGGHSAKVVNTWDSGNTATLGSTTVPIVFGSLLQEDEYDFSGALARSTLRHYLWQDNASYKNANFLSLPSSIIAKDGSGKQVEQNTYGYDEYAVNSSGVNTGFVAPPAGGSIRGNLTSTHRFLNGSAVSTTNCPIAVTNGFLVTYSTYNDTGTLSQATDACGTSAGDPKHTTTFSYSSGFAGAYLTTVTNALGQASSTNYDFNTGLRTTFTDQNQQSSNFQYDNMLRLTQATHPDQGQTNLRYQVSAFPFGISVQKKINATQYLTGMSLVDGLGRFTQTQVTSDPEGTVFTDTTYDAVGRKATISNPHRSSPSSTDGITAFQYDALGRTLKTVKPDSNVTTAQYTDNCTTTTDETGRQRKACLDAFARLVEIDEPSALTAGSAAGGTVTVNGILQSATPGGSPPTVATGSVTINGSEQAPKTVTTTPANPASVTVIVGGSDGKNTQSITTCTARGCTTRTFAVPDTGHFQYVVTAGGTVLTSSQVTYNASTSTSGLAQSLSNALPSNSLVTVSYTSGQSQFTITTTATGSATNNSTLSTSIVTDCPTSDTMTCGAQGWTITASRNFTGGSNAVTKTTYDAGTVTVAVNGHPDAVSFGQGDNANTVASRLVTQINGDSSAFVTAKLSPTGASATSTTVNLTSKTTGTAANVSLASPAPTYDTTDFSSGSFGTATSGSVLTNGTNAAGGTTVYDSGTVSVSVGGFSGAPVSYGQSSNSTAAQVASALAASLNVPGSPVTTSPSGTNITITYGTLGVTGNVSVSIASLSNNPAQFPGGSFSGSGSLSGGANPQPGSLTSPYVTLFAYDALNNLLSVNQKGDGSQPARVRAFTYDSLSRPLTANNPESGAISYAYDANGNMITKTAPAPNQTGSATVTTTNSYDVLNRHTQKSYSDGTPTAHFLYDLNPGWGPPETNIIGRMTMAYNTPFLAASIFSYDSVGRVNMNDQCTPFNCGTAAFNTAYTYDLLGDMTSFTNQVGVIFTQSFDSAGRPTTLTSTYVDAQHPATLATVDPTAGYYPFGAIRKVTYGNGLTETAVYNTRLQPCRTNVNSSATALAQCGDAIPSGNVQDYSYGFNLGAGDNGNLASMSAAGAQTFSRAYTFDALNRLSTLADSATAQLCKGLSWSYDPWGNRTGQSVTAGSCFSSEVAVDANNRLLGAPYQYDAAGNLTADGNHTYTYDAENRLITVDSGSTATYAYDALGRRVEKVTSAGKIEYIYDLADRVLSEHFVNIGGYTGWGLGYIYFGGGLLAEYNLGKNSSPTIFVHKDHLGSTRLVTNLNQSIADNVDYLPFGEQISGATGTSHKFTGKERDAESSLDDFGARYYSSALGRFTVTDPMMLTAKRLLNPQRLNLYAYAVDNPITLLDPTGEEGAGPLPAGVYNAVQNLYDASYGYAQREVSGFRNGERDFPHERIVAETANAQKNLEDATKDFHGTFAEGMAQSAYDDSLDRLTKFDEDVVSATALAAVAEWKLTASEDELKEAVSWIDGLNHPGASTFLDKVKDKLDDKACERSFWCGFAKGFVALLPDRQQNLRNLVRNDIQAQLDKIYYNKVHNSPSRKPKPKSGGCTTQMSNSQSHPCETSQ